MLSGGLFTISYFRSIFTKEINNSWSASLIKPIFALLNYISISKWRFIYILLGWISATVWGLEKSSNGSCMLNHIYVQIALNFLSLVFFYALRSLSLAALDSTIIFIGSVYLGILFHKLDKKVFYPYLIYVIWVLYELAFGPFRYFLNQ